MDLANLKSNVHKLDIDKLKNVPTSLTNLKSKVDKLDVYKLVPASVDLSKLSVSVKKDVVKKGAYNGKIKNIQDEILDITNLAAKTALNAKINEVKGEIPNITNLATNASLNASNLVKKTYYNTKLSEIEKKVTEQNHDKYITTPELNKFISSNFDLRFKPANLASNSDIANFAKKTDFDNKPSKKVKAISIKELTKDLIDKFSILNGAKYFSLGIFQNYLASIPDKKYIKYFTSTTQVESWKSNGMSEEGIENITKTDSNFAPTFVDNDLSPDKNFNEHCLIKIIYLLLKK